MPRPVYIICSESGAEDSQTGLVSHFNVLEKLVKPEPPQHLRREGNLAPIPVMTIRVTAVWMAQGDASEQEYEFETAFYFPVGKGEQVVQTGHFYFGESKPFYRIVTLAQGFLHHAAGILRVESRIRPIGSVDWLRQDYPLILEDSTLSPHTS